MERFLGTWRLVDTQNFDNYMRELGVDFATRQVGNVLKPTTIIKVDGDNVILQTKSTYRSTEIIFQLDKPFNEHTADNRDCKKEKPVGSLIQTSSRAVLFGLKWKEIFLFHQCKYIGVEKAFELRFVLNEKCQ
ncbi:fatty acid-binding protein, heart-like isoform X3 [Stegostoma tigrinum]|uniref:fatty acid-binding protein, heart-like isoform X3 n=1 Tax=Stegostoma tigrinum TaxID=3053191 RepID=UPI00202B1B2E|nr:fatty acid-binding protein, heart-like isoform X3 [Stegostoma tigrinum]